MLTAYRRCFIGSNGNVLGLEGKPPMPFTQVELPTLGYTSGVSTTQWLPVPDGVIAYDDIGGGPLVVCAPSSGDVRAEYRFLRPYLYAAGFRVATMDLRGHGDSSVGWRDYSTAAIGSDLVALIQHLDTGPAYVIGTSNAAGAAVCAATSSPERVAGLVLIGPVVRDAAVDWIEQWILNALLIRPWGPKLWSMYLQSFYPSQKPADFDAYRAYILANMREAGRVEALRALLNSSHADVEARLNHVAVPTLVIMGNEDPEFKDPCAEALWIADQTHGSVLTVEAVGHFPHAETPDRVGPEIVRFLQWCGRRG
jgi:pimeloyl-ACP methyl ester carboxylesterase